MSISRKTQKDLKKLKKEAAALWKHQQEVLAHASKVAEGAKKKLAKASKAEIQPRIDDALEKVKPTIDSSVDYARASAHSAKETLKRTVLPAIGATAASAVTLFEMAKNPVIRRSILQGKIDGNKLRAIAQPPQKKKRGFFGKLLMVIGIIAVAGTAYATWQALRADDDLWIDTDEEAAAKSEEN